MRAAEEWVAVNATTQTVSLPTHAAGDMLIVRAACKPYTATITCSTTGWNPVGNQYTNGTTANGNGTGSLAFRTFYKIAESASETNPVIAWGTTAAPGGAVAISYQKGSDEFWITPTGAGGGDSTARTSQTCTISSHISVTAGDMIDFWLAWCDNYASTNPTITQTGVTYDTVAEYPATALSSATSNDMAADGGYRLASSGTSSAAAVVTATFGNSEEGGAWQTRLRVATSSRSYAQANAKIKAIGVQGYAQANAQISAAGGGQAAYVQSIGSNSTTSTVTSLVISTSKTVTVGNTIIVIFASYNTTAPTSVVDNLGNTYSEISYKSYTSPTFNERMYAAPITTGGTLTSLTANFSSRSYVSIVADEFSGLSASSTDGGNSSGSSATATWSSSSTIPANGIIIGGVVSQNPRTHTAGSASGSPSTSISMGTKADSPNDPSTSLAYAISSGSEVTSFVGTTSLGLSTAWIGTSRIFGPAAGATTKTTYAQAQATIFATYRGYAQSQVYTVYPDTLAYDTFTRTESNTWGTSDSNHVWTVNGYGSNPQNNFDVASGVGTISIPAAGSGYQQSARLGAYFLRGDYSFKFKGPAVSGATLNIQAIFRYLHMGSVSKDAYKLVIFILTDNQFDIQFQRVVDGSSTGFGGGLNGRSYVADTWFNVRVQFWQSNSTTTSMRGRVWKASDPEPTTWDQTQTDSTAGMLQNMYTPIGIDALVGSAWTGDLPAIISFDDINMADELPTRVSALAQTTISVAAVTYTSYAQSLARIKQTYPFTSITTYAQDSFTRTVSNGWGTADIGGAWTSSANPSWDSVDGSAAKIAIATGDTSEFLRLDSVSVSDIDQCITWSMDKIPTGAVAAVHLFARRDSNNYYVNVRCYIGTTGTVTLNFRAFTSSGNYTLATETSSLGTYGVGDTWRLRFRVYGNMVYAKTWNSTSSEPTAWQTSADISSYSIPSTGSIGVWAWNSASISNLPITYTYDNYLAQSPYDFPFAQAQAQISAAVAVTYRGYAQAQTHIKQTYRVWAQGQAQIKTTYKVYAQVNAKIILLRQVNAQAQAIIKQTYRSYAQSQAKIILSSIKGYAQSQAWIKRAYQSYAQAQSRIKQTYRGYAQAQGQVKQIYRVWAQANTKVILSNLQAYAQGQVQIKTTYRGYAQANAKIILSGLLVYAQAQSRIKQTYQNYAQGQAWIKQTYRFYAQANTKIILSALQVYAQAQAIIKQTYQGYAQGQAKIILSNVKGYAQANVKIILSGLQGYAQSQVCIKSTYLGYAQGNTYIKVTGINSCAQAQAQIKQAYQAYAQAQVQLRTSYNGYAQAQSRIKTTYITWAQGNALIKATSNTYAQAQAQVKQTYRVWAQGNAKIILSNLQGYAQTQATIKATYTVFAQAQTYIKLDALQAYAQGQAQIKTTYKDYAQAQAYIKQTYLAYAQSQASIKATYLAYAQAQAIIKTTYQRYAQTQSLIKQIYNAHGQAQAKIILSGLNVYAQAQAQIKAVYLGYAQSNTYIKLSGIIYSAQAQSLIVVKDIEAFAQAGATIAATGQGYAQAEVEIYIPQIARPIADISNDGWVRTVRD